MLIVISPAKRLDVSKLNRNIEYSQPEFLEEAKILVNILKKYSPSQLAKKMKVNAELAQLTADRFQNWHLPFTDENAKQALLTFKGDVFNGIDAEKMTMKDLDFAQQHLRILSGLYGVLRPLDLIQPYRLEMGTSLKGRGFKSLYDFWRDHINKFIGQELSNKSKVLINLASKEYFKVIDDNQLNATVIEPDFREYKNGEYRFIHVLGKKARGLMVRYIINNKISDPEKLKLFNLEGYSYNDRLTEGNKWVFTRE